MHVFISNIKLNKFLMFNTFKLMFSKVPKKL